MTTAKHSMKDYSMDGEENLQRQSEVILKVLALFAHTDSMKAYAEGLTEVLSEATGCPCVGLRIIQADKSEPFLAHIGCDGADADPPGVLALPISWKGEDLGTLLLYDPARVPLPKDVVDVMESTRLLVDEAIWRFSVEERLEESSEKLQSVVHGLPLPIWIINQSREVVFQNEVHKERFGTAAEGGTTCFSLLYGREESCQVCHLEDCIAGNPGQYEWRAPMGGKTYDILNVPYVSTFGEKCQMSIFIDVTERVDALQQLRQTQRLDSLGSLSAGIAHDFNNVLAGIIGYAQLGVQRRRSADDEDCNALFEQIGSIAERGAELTRKILAFSRLQPLKPRPFDINAVVEGMQQMIRPLAGDRITFETDLGANVWGVMADRGQIEQVLMNLCVNSVESMPGGGRLALTTKNVVADRMARILGNGIPVNGIQIQVSDTGQGMPEEVVSKAFEPFFTTKGRGRGTGLGLSVSYGIVKQHGGAIHVESNVGRGTSVTVFLPSTDVTPSTLVQPIPERTPGRFEGIRVLVVEDDQPIREMVARYLEELGVLVSHSGEGREGIEMIGGREFDILVTDIAMPGINGVELARRSAEIRPGLPILFMTGCSDASIEQYGMPEDALLLRKPFKLDDLVDRMTEALGQ